MAEKIAVPESAKPGDRFIIRLTGSGWNNELAKNVGLIEGLTIAAKLSDEVDRDEFLIELNPSLATNDSPWPAYLPVGEAGDGGEWGCELIKPAPPTAAEILASIPGEGVDMVNSPPHYVSGGMEVVDVIEAFDIDRKSGHLQNVVKYALRAGEKGNLQEDVDKLVWYAERLQKRVRENGGTF